MLRKTVFIFTESLGVSWRYSSSQPRAESGPNSALHAGGTVGVRDLNGQVDRHCLVPLAWALGLGRHNKSSPPDGAAAKGNVRDREWRLCNTHPTRTWARVSAART